MSTFLATPEVEEYARQLFAVYVYERDKESACRPIQQRFIASFAEFTGSGVEEISIIGNRLFEMLVGSCETALHESAQAGVLGSHEVLSSLRYRALRDELQAIRKNQELAGRSRLCTVQEALDFEKLYRRQVAERHKDVMAAAIDSAPRLPIDSIFVAPRFSEEAGAKGTQPAILEMSDVLADAYRIVILGTPGGGKSTFSWKVCHDVASRYEERLFAGRAVTPILVVLREYGVAKMERSTSILDFIESNAASRYQVKPVVGAFEYLLLNGRVVVVFDGLDELLDTSYRREVSGDIESFCSLYPTVPILVTSREVGYDQAPLDAGVFRVLRLAAFSEDQVQEYVRKWFGNVGDLDPGERQAKVTGFLAESGGVEDLRSNPLMLGLMCSVYRQENYIPRNRPDVYEKCATLLFDRWDKSRGISPALPFQEHVRPAMLYLAYWMYDERTMQEGVTECRLISKTSEYLDRFLYDDQAKAEFAATRFVEFCRGRAWVFTDVGTTLAGERLYQFTHRTFLEYFTAVQLVRTHPTPAALAGFLAPKIAGGEWDVVAQLSVQILNRNVDCGGDELLRGLVNRVDEASRADRTATLVFTMRCLGFLVPSPAVTNLVGRSALKHLDSDCAALVGAMVVCSVENRSGLRRCMEDAVAEACRGLWTDRQAAFLIEVIHTVLLGGLGVSGASSSCVTFWRAVAHDLAVKVREKAFELAPRSFEIGSDLFDHGGVTLAQLVVWYGIDCLFWDRPYAFYPNSARVSIALHCLMGGGAAQVNPGSEDEGVRSPSLLGAIGNLFLADPGPAASFAASESEAMEGYFILEARNGRFIHQPAGDEAFGCFCLRAVFKERMEQRGLSRRSGPERLEPIPVVAALLLGRERVIEPREVVDAMEQAAFSSSQRRLALEWTEGRFSFCGVRSPQGSLGKPSLLAPLATIRINPGK